MAKKKQTDAEARESASSLSCKEMLLGLGLVTLSGFLLWLAFPPAELGAAAWIALVPWLVVVGRAPTRRAAILSAVVGYLLFAAQLYWLWYVTAAGWLVLAFYCALYWPLAAVLLNRFRKAGLPFILTVPILFAALEFVRANFLTGFPFLLIGHTQYRCLPIIQIADITGVYGITFLLGLVNGLLADLILGRFKVTRNSLLKLGLTLAAYIVVLSYGVVRLRPETGSDAPTRRLFLVQANVPIDLKHSPSPDDRLNNLERHVRLSMGAKEKEVDLILWAETMLPIWLNLAADDDIMWRVATDPKKADLARLMDATRKAVKRTTRETGAHALFGSETFLLGTNRRFNSAYFVSPEGKILGRYDKIHRVVFGEYTPLGNIFPFLKKLRPPQMGDDLSAGRFRRLFELPCPDGGTHKFGVTICYEDSVAGLFRKSVRDGADFMVNITNDGWFHDSTELDVHLAVCIFRAVENHVTIARCANTGISAVISPTGRILKKLVREDGKYREIEGALLMDMPVAKWPGFYTRHGDVFAWLCLAGVVVMVAVSIFRKRPERAGYDGPEQRPA